MRNVRIFVFVLGLAVCSGRAAQAQDTGADLSAALAGALSDAVDSPEPDQTGRSASGGDALLDQMRAALADGMAADQEGQQ